MPCASTKTECSTLTRARPGPAPALGNENRPQPRCDRRLREFSQTPMAARPWGARLAARQARQAVGGRFLLAAEMRRAVPGLVQGRGIERPADDGFGLE